MLVVPFTYKKGSLIKNTKNLHIESRQIQGLEDTNEAFLLIK